MKIQTFDVPEWSGSVCMRPMSLGARIDLDTFAGDANLFLLVHSLCDEAGTLLFTEEDIPLLGRKSSRVVRRLRDHAAKLSGIDRDGFDARIRAMERSATLKYAHELAERLSMTVGELRQRMDSSEFVDFMAFDLVHMPDSWNQSAQICYYLCHLNGKPTRKLKIDDFLPKKRKAWQTDGEMKSTMNALMALVNRKP